MTEPFRPDDELVSAVLDGEATPEERARVEADPELRARRDEFAAARDLVATPPPAPPDDVRERAIAAALAEQHARDPVVTPLAPRRRAHPDRRFLAAAAAVLFALVAAGFLANGLGDDGDGEVATRVEDEASDSGGGDAAAEEAPDAALETYALVETALGEVADEVELRTAVARALPDEFAADLSDAGGGEGQGNEGDAPAPETTGTASADGRFDADACQADLEAADPGLSGLLLRATAVYEGTPAVVHVFALADGERQVVVVTADGCAVLTRFLL